MRELLAHSADINKSIPYQTYKSHINGCLKRAAKTLRQMKPYMDPEEFRMLKILVYLSILFHDLGKLYTESQDLFHNGFDGKKMLNHVDAGVAYLYSIAEKNEDPQVREAYILSAWIIHAHHLGFNFDPKDFEKLRDDNPIKARCPWMKYDDCVRDFTDKQLSVLIDAHNTINIPCPKRPKVKNVHPLLLRLALSIVVDADHYDTANHYKSFIPSKPAKLKAKKRLESLDKYIQKKYEESLKKFGNTETVQIRQEMYLACRNSEVDSPITSCGGEVGTGKTTAIMAFALNQCGKHNLRRVVYVSPRISILSQSSDVYRGLILGKEDPVHVVGELHHEVEYDNDSLSEKIYATTYNCPIIATTSVQHTETLLSHKTSRLKKLNQEAGSFIIFDEIHLHMKSEHWPLFLKQLQYLVEKCGCRAMFVSGSMVNFWENEDIKRASGFNIPVVPILPKELSKRTLDREKRRITKSKIQKPMNLIEVCDWIESFKTSKIAIFNTIQNACVVAKELLRRRGRDYVELLASCLYPAHKERVNEKIIQRLNTRPDDDWALIATTIANTGMDFSFRQGMCQNSSFLDAEQCGGRVNRHGECGTTEFFVFDLIKNDTFSPFTDNPNFSTSQQILNEMYTRGKIGPEFCNEAMQKEIERSSDFSFKDSNGKTISQNSMIKWENQKKIRAVSENYRIINEKKFEVLINDSVLDKDFPSSSDITRNSVQIFEQKKDDFLKMRLIKESRLDGLYVWTNLKPYDEDLFGYMGAIL